MRSDRPRLTPHAFALLLVAATAAIRAAFLSNQASHPFFLSGVAVAAGAWLGGATSGVAATLAALLVARLAGQPDLTASMLFVAEGLTLTCVAAYARASLDRAGQGLACADARINELLGDERRLRRLDAASSRLEQLAAECGAFIVNDAGRILEWRDSAARLFGWSADAIRGQSAEQLFTEGDGTSFDRLVVGTSEVAPHQFARACRRADGTSFDADVEIHRLADEGLRSFVVVVRDRTRDQEWRNFADASADLQSTLREEADVALRQLATLQHVVDPALSLLPTAQAITALLDRLRAAIDADGIALIRGGRHRRRIVSATDGLRPDPSADRRPSDGWIPQAGRILIVHNDPARVDLASAVAWRDEPASLISVPVGSGSHVEGTIEVVGIKPRRSTEWEIALVQVVAAQVAVRLQSESMFGADAVA